MVPPRSFAAVFPLLVLASAALTVTAGPQWAPPVGVGVVIGGDSMEPTICPGDLVVYRDGTDIDEGDVITFHTAAAPVPITTHRVVDVTERGYVTQGDNVHTTDFRWIGYVEDEEVIGEVFLVASMRGCAGRPDGRRLADTARDGRVMRGVLGAD